MRNRVWVMGAGVLFAAAMSSSVGAVPPLPGRGAVARKKTCYLNTPALRRRAAALRAPRVGSAFPGLPANPAPKVAVVVVDFSGTTIANSGADRAVFFQKVRDFFEENSYGVFAPTFTLTAVYALPSPLYVYGADQANGDPGDYVTLFTHTATAIGALDLRGYDELMIYHAGYGEESSRVPSDIWSVYYPGDRSMGGKSFDGFTVVPELEAGADALAVICHEYGHQMGLPDLYDTVSGKSTTGAWDVMDYPWTGSPVGSNPPHLGAWSKKFLGFGAATVLASSGPVTWPPAETAGVFRQISYPAQEYFLTEHRSRTAGAYDQGLPQSAGAALAVWHIDDGVALNDWNLSQNIVNTASLNGGRNGVQLIPADGTGPGPSDGNLGQENGFTNGSIFSPPQSNLFSGAASGLTISNIAGLGSALASADVFFFAVSPSMAIARVINYPNPGGDPTKFPVRSGAAAGTVTTVTAFLSQPVSAGQIKLSIFTSEGDPVRQVEGASIRFQSAGSADNKWVYEYDWDGRTDGGDDAAPGLYLYRYAAGDEFKTGKLVIIR